MSEDLKTIKDARKKIASLSEKEAANYIRSEILPKKNVAASE